MRLVTFAGDGHRASAVGALLPCGRILDLQAAYEVLLVAQGTPAAEAASASGRAIPATMEAFVAGGLPCLGAAQRTLALGPELAQEKKQLRTPGGRPLSFGTREVRILAPIGRPNAIRDVVGFEDHARAGAARRGVELAAGWHTRPFSYRGNHRAILGPDEPLPRPRLTRELDFELEVACVVGRDLRDAEQDEAGAAIFGFTIMNDWSARDVQRAEMESRMGPSKSKDFATSLGPCILVAEPGAPHPPLGMAARVNGRTVCEANLGAAFWTFPAMLSFASRDETVWATDVFGSGTPFGGCMLDHGGPWLEPGDVVELEVEGIGVLRNAVVAPAFP
jgi:2-keto-4-pentenoate hydratase/2-oxohepta-3-ene-1,7-dioic acid hydratase in catechol pathway